MRVVERALAHTLIQMQTEKAEQSTRHIENFMQKMYWITERWQRRQRQGWRWQITTSNVYCSRSDSFCVCVPRSFTSVVVALMSLLLSARILTIFVYGYMDMWAIDVNHIISLGIDSHRETFCLLISIDLLLLCLICLTNGENVAKNQADQIDLFIHLSFPTFLPPLKRNECIQFLNFSLLKAKSHNAIRWLKCKSVNFSFRM